MADDTRIHIATLHCDAVTLAILQESMSGSVRTASNLSALLDEFEGAAVGLAVIDLTKTNEPAWKVEIEELRARLPQVAIVAIADGRDDASVEAVFSLGAADVVRKPIRPRELVARLRKRLCDLTLQAGKSEIHFADLSYDQLKRRLHCRGQTVDLTATSAMLLANLLATPSIIIPRAELKLRVWSAKAVAEGALDRQMHSLRTILRDLGSSVIITTVYNQGYLVSQASAEDSNESF